MGKTMAPLGFAGPVVMSLYAALCGGCTAAQAARRAPATDRMPRGALSAIHVFVAPSGDVSMRRYDEKKNAMPTHVFNGPGNRPDQGYAMATEEDGGVIVVWYQWASNETRLSIRRCSRSGKILWTRPVDGNCAVLDANGRLDAASC